MPQPDTSWDADERERETAVEQSPVRFTAMVPLLLRFPLRLFVPR